MESIKDLFKTGLKGIIYDCDGVMINSRAANNLFYNSVLAYFNLPPMTHEQELYSFMASGLEALLYILPKELHKEIDYVVTHVVNYDRDIVPKLTLMPGFREFVTEMANFGLKQAMCTNRTAHGFDAVLRFFDFPAYFDPIMTVSVVKPKPDPEGACKIVETWQFSPKEIMYIGDSTHDLAAARGAGTHFCAINALDFTGDITVNSYEELRQILAPILPIN